MKTVKNWVYGVKSIDIENAVSNAILLAHRYRNRLCELEHDKRSRHEQLLQKLAPEYVAACQSVEAIEKQLADARDAIQTERIKQRKKTPAGVSQYQDAAAAAKKLLKELRAARKIAKQRAYAEIEVSAAMLANAEQHKAERKLAKAEAGLYWATEAVVNQSCQSFASGSPPRFKRYDGEGQLAVQLQGGLETCQASQANTLCYFGHTTGKLTECFIRIGSEERKPVFARVQVIMHRPLPDGAIKWAYLERRMIANSPKWFVRLTVETQAGTDRNQSTWVALHVGWRSTPNGGVQAGLWQGSDGKRGAIVLKEKHCRDYATLDYIRSQRDRAMDNAKVWIKAWLKSQPYQPEWMAEAITTMHLWRSEARLAKLAMKCREIAGELVDTSIEIPQDVVSHYMPPGRFDFGTVALAMVKTMPEARYTRSFNGKSIYGVYADQSFRVSNHLPDSGEYLSANRTEDVSLLADALKHGKVTLSALDALERWRKVDTVRWQHEARLGKRISRRRTDLFRTTAKQLSDRYGVVYIGKIDAKELTENSSPEDLERDNTQSHRHAKWAAVSDLIRLVGEKFPLHALHVDTKNLTRQCHKCGTLAAKNQRKVQCLECGATWDCDDNAIENTIARGEAMQKSGGLLALRKAQVEKEKSAEAKLAKMQQAARDKRAARKVVA